MDLKFPGLYTMHLREVVRANVGEHGIGRAGPIGKDEVSQAHGWCMNKVVSPAFFLSLLIVPGGCKSHEKIFKITSYPQGAKIYVDAKQRGITDMERLAISFDSKPLATIRLEREGYQSDGINVSMESPEVISFFLQESPNNQQIIKGLEKISDKLELLIQELKRSSPEKSNS